MSMTPEQPAIVERCGSCRKWKKSKHYDCQHNGAWGGCSAKLETKFEPKEARADTGKETP